MGVRAKIGGFKESGVADAHRPPVHPLTLAFETAGLNRAFEQSVTKRSLSFVRISLLLAIALYMVFAWLDRIVTPEVVAELMAIRIASITMFIGCIYLTFREWGIDHFQFLISMVVVLAGLGIIGMILVSESIGGYHYYAGLLLAIMYAHGLLRLRFIYASLTTWFVIFSYITATVWLEVTPFEIYVNNIFFLVSANIMGMFASYWLEYYMKAVFWNDRMLIEKNRELQAQYQLKSDELEAARQMQLNMLPQKCPYLPDYQFCFSMKAASEVGGDYYDFQISEDGAVTFGIGDATGHGLQASVMVTVMKLLFSEHAGKTDIVEFLKQASHSISLMDLRKIYMAFAIGRLRDDSTLELAGAGIPPAFIYRAESGTIEQIPLKGLPLGSKVSYPYKMTRTRIGPEDVVVLMTDGFPELFNGHGEMLGYERVKGLIRESAHRSPEEIIDHLHAASTSWIKDGSPTDDITFFVFKRRAEIDTKRPPAPAPEGRTSRKKTKAGVSQGVQPR